MAGLARSATCCRSPAGRESWRRPWSDRWSADLRGGIGGQTGVPGQVVDIDSLLLNTAGLALAHLRSSRRPAHCAPSRAPGAAPAPVAVRQDEPARGRTPTIPRVGIAP
ncbi:VanZ family protein [Streptomyces shaanxiensis]